MAEKSEMKFGSVQEILEFAIQKEAEAHDFYLEWSGRMEKASMKKKLQDFANEEMKHKEKLTAIKANKLQMQALSPEKKVIDLKIGDYLVDVDPSTDLDYQGALILAMKKEKKAFKLYNDLAEMTQNENIRTLFLGLALEEAKHKLRLETEYDEYILTEN
ncbi:MAG: ferritin family protein [Acidobacteriota bacterium]|jgi:rubrerythrin